jgi:uncharacterized protein YegL
MSGFEAFTVSPSKPLPVLVLADVSTSMEQEGKIDVLNRSIDTMARTFAELDDSRDEVRLAVIAFGGSAARLVQAPVAARDFSWQPMSTLGGTPLGSALELARELLDDRELIPERAYRPTLILASDGHPTDRWETPLRQLVADKRVAGALRLAIAIGADANERILREFIGGPDAKVMHAHEAQDIAEYFMRITMSVSRALVSGEYQTRTALEPDVGDDLDELDAGA